MVGIDWFQLFCTINVKINKPRSQVVVRDFARPWEVVGPERLWKPPREIQYRKSAPSRDNNLFQKLENIFQETWQLWLEMEKERKREMDREKLPLFQEKWKSLRKEKPLLLQGTFSYKERFTQKRVCSSRDAETVLHPPVESRQVKAARSLCLWERWQIRPVDKNEKFKLTCTSLLDLQNEG